METMFAWHGDPALKAEVVARMRAHREADEIVQGLYQLLSDDFASGYRGCLIGCTLPAQPAYSHDQIGSYGAEGVEPRQPAAGWHGRVEELYGIPRSVGYLLDRIFEGLPTDEGAHAVFAVASIEAVPVGADLSLVSSHLMLEILAHPERGVHRLTGEGSAQRTAVETVIGLYTRRLSGDEPTRVEWVNARKAAADAAYAADDAAYADAAYAAADAAYAAYAAAAYAAAAADAAYAAYAAYAAAAYAAAAYAAVAYAAAAYDWWSWAAERLLHHLANAPIPAATAGTLTSG